MKATNRKPAISVLTLAVQGALIAMFAMPLAAMAEGDADVATLTNPTNHLEIGAGNVSKSSDKFGEYNGLNESGVYGIGSINLRGGDSYGQKDGTKRWSVTGTDLGTTSRELGATMSNQGSWNVGVNYDELRHNITDTYQTPLQGSMGGNSFVMPVGFGTIGTLRPGTALPYGTQVLNGTQLTYFHTEKVHTDRKNATFNAGYNFDRQWGMQFDFNRLTQDGAKLISAATDGNVLPIGATLAGYAVGKEAILMLMNPTNYQTDNMNLALNWIGDKAHFTGSYSLSKFRDANNGLSFSNPYDAGHSTGGTVLGAAFPVNVLSTAPDNDFQQLNLTGGYDISSATKLAGGISYGRNTQNSSFINADQMVGGILPQSSLDGLVVTQHADLKLTNQTTRDLTLSTGLKYNKRDNRTASNTYAFNDLGAAAITSISTPLSNKKTQFELAGDYRLNQHQRLHAGYEYEQVQRWCDNSPSAAAILAASPGIGGTTAAPAPANAAAAYYALGTSCVQVPKSTDNKLVLNYRLNASEDLIFNAGYAYSKRRSDVNGSFYNPMQGQNQGFELPGYVAYFESSRNEQLIKAGVNWQALDRLNVSLNGRYVDDKYDAALGVQNGSAWSTNLDAAYSITEHTSAGAYVTVQNRKRNLLNDGWGHQTAQYGTAIAGGSLTQPWTNDLSLDDNTIGVNAKHGGMMGGKLDMTADLMYSLSKSTYSTSVNYVNAACTAPSNAGYVCGTLPDIKSELIRFKLEGDYSMDKASTVRLGYIYQNLKSTDYYYNAYQTGYTPTTMLPTNQQAPSYAVNVVYASYIFNF